MPVRYYKPTSKGRRGATVSDYSDVTTNVPQKKLTVALRHTGGRNNVGRLSMRHIGGGNRKRYRIIDFRRTKDNIPGIVETIEYDPNRSPRIALILYKDGERRYILAPEDLKVGDEVMSGEKVEPRVGNCMPLKSIPTGQFIHNVELTPGQGGQMARSAGTFAQLMAKEGNYADVVLPSGEIRKIHIRCRATVGKIGNSDWANIVLGKAGRSRHRGIRPINRGVSRNPVDHPNGGGAGKSKSGGGWQQLTSPWGLLAKGYKTRRKRKDSSRFIVVWRDGRTVKQK